MVAEAAAITELTVTEAAAFAGVSDRTIRNWIHDGLLAATNAPGGRKVRQDDVVGVLREKGYAPPELATPAILPDAGPAVEVRQAPARPDTPAIDVREPARNGHAPHGALPKTSPTLPQSQPENGQQPTPSLTPELINVVLQPLVAQLNAANARAERKERENLELAGRVGYLQAKVQQYEARVLLLEAPKEAPAIPLPPPAQDARMPQEAPFTLTREEVPFEALPPTPSSLAASGLPSPSPWWRRLFGE